MRRQHAAQQPRGPSDRLDHAARPRLATRGAAARATTEAFAGRRPGTTANGARCTQHPATPRRQRCEATAAEPVGRAATATRPGRLNPRHQRDGNAARQRRLRKGARTTTTTASGDGGKRRRRQAAKRRRGTRRRQTASCSSGHGGRRPVAMATRQRHFGTLTYTLAPVFPADPTNVSLGNSTSLCSFPHAVATKSRGQMGQGRLTEKRNRNQNRHCSLRSDACNNLERHHCVS